MPATARAITPISCSSSVSEKVTFQHRALQRLGVGLNDVLAGQIDGFVDQLSTSLPHIKSGKLRPLVVIGPQRVAELPDVPSLADVGIAPFDGGTTARHVAFAAKRPSPSSRRSTRR